MFRDRIDAGQQLANKLSSYKNSEAVVLALPRGGVISGFEIARKLSLPLDIIVVRKIGHPSNPEYAIGAVDEFGTAIFDEVETSAADKRWLEEKVLEEKEEAKRRADLYRQDNEPLSLANKVVIIVDDGIATGLSIRLAVRFAKQSHAHKIIVAVPVAPLEVIDTIKAEGADEMIVLIDPKEYRGAVGAHYRYFGQAGDKEVYRLLHTKTV